MVGLLDIAPSNRSVKTSLGDVSVPGLSLNAIVCIIKRHPQLLEIFQSKEISIGYEKILDLGLDVAASFLAAGLGYAGDEKAEERCKNLRPEDAIDLAEAILEESFPKGPKNFFEKVTKAMEKLSESKQPLVTNS